MKGNILDSINSSIGSLGILGKIGLEKIGLSAYKPEKIDLNRSETKLL